jgi:hypothetical protein
MKPKHFVFPALMVVATAATAGATVPISRPSPTTVPALPPARTAAAIAAPLTLVQKGALLADIIAQTHALPVPPPPGLPNPLSLSSSTASATNPAILDFELHHPLSVWAANGAAAPVSFSGCSQCLEPQVAVAWVSPPNAVYMVDCTVSDQANGANVSETDWGNGHISPVPYATPTHIVFAATAMASTPARWGSTLSFSAIAGFRLTADKDWTFSGCEVTLAGAVP